MECKAVALARKARDSRLRRKRPPGTEYVVKYLFWRRAFLYAKIKFSPI